MFLKRLFIAFVTIVMVSACTETDPKQGIGTLLGAAGGAALGSQVGDGSGRVAAIALGTLLGAYAGSEIGSSLDKADQMYASRAANNAFESMRSGTTSTWQNPDSGNSGTITPTSTYQTPNGQYCREYQQTVTVGGKTQQAYGTACRQPDGAWQIVK